MKDKLLGTLGICRKGGKLITGYEAVIEGAAAGKVFLILLSSDLSPKSGKETRFQAAKYSVEVRSAPITMEDMKARFGKRSGILGVADQGLADTVRRICNACEEDSIL